MFAQTWSAAVQGIDGVPVRVEVNMSPGLPTLSVVGLPQGAVREGRDRVQAALRNTGWPIPHQRITVNLAPADLKKEGSGFDLPIAVALLAGMETIPTAGLGTRVFLGELGLDGRIRPVRGVLPVALACLAMGRTCLVVPRANAPEARAAGGGLQVVPAAHLGEVVRWLGAGGPLGDALSAYFGDLGGASDPGSELPGSRVLGRHPDLAGVIGQPLARRALEVAAAGGHNLLLTGPPGTGKTLLARALPGILPSLTPRESRTVTAIHSVAGLLPPEEGLVRAPPFRAPHHGISPVGLVGGGNPLRPGEVSLAHGGVLFLDELPEFGRASLEALRQPMEDASVWVVRARARARFPSRFILAAAMNPCPCGRFGRGGGDEGCTCDRGQVERYRSRISGPLLDRLDLHVQVERVDPSRLLDGDRSEEDTVSVRERVLRARHRQRERALGRAELNAAIPASHLPERLEVEAEGLALLRVAARRFALSARGIHRVLRVSRTVADLAGTRRVTDEHVAEALQFRTDPGPDATEVRTGLPTGTSPRT